MYSCFLNLSRFTLRTFPAFSCMFFFFRIDDAMVYGSYIYCFNMVATRD